MTKAGISSIESALIRWAAYFEACPESFECCSVCGAQRFPSGSLEARVGFRLVRKQYHPPVFCRVYVARKKAQLRRVGGLIRLRFQYLFRLIRSLRGS